MNNNNKNNLNPNFVSGFVDAEGCFHVSIVDKAELKAGKSVRVLFQISLHKKDKALLDQITNFFGVGAVIDRKDGAFYYKVSQVKDLMLIINHFYKYPLITQKRADFEFFKQIVEKMNRKEHLTTEGLQEIVNIKASMNFGVLSDNLLTWFPYTVAVSRPIIKDPVVYDPEWISGFVDGEGCFFVNIYKRKDSILGEGVKLVFKITQDERNSDLLASFVEIFGCGGIYNQSKSTGNVLDFMVSGLSDITDKVIPFFLAHPLQGAKKKELADFIKVAELMKLKAHLTRDGLEQIKIIKAGMNRGR
jgi:LAGLIDADG endonuclease